MDNEVLAEEIKKIILPVIEEEDCELVELKLNISKGNSALRLFVDTKSGGINADICARINRKIGDALDLADIIKESYTLEVSSPGLDRPLSTESDFRRNLNQPVKFFLNQPINGKIEIDGVVKKVDLQTVVIESKTGTLEIPLLKITKAKRIV